MKPATELLGSVNRFMIVFDLALGSGALLAPEATLRVLDQQPGPPRSAITRQAP